MKKTKNNKIPKKAKKVFEDISGNQWLNIVNSSGDSKLTELKISYYKLSDGKLAVILRNNWKTLISELVSNEDELDKEELRLTNIYKLFSSAEINHTNVFLDLGKLLKQPL